MRNERKSFSTLWLTVVLLTCATARVSSGQDSKSLAVEMDGMCLEKLANWQGDFYEEIGQGLGLAYRKNSAAQVFLLTKNADQDEACKRANGHTIVATLHLPLVPTDQWVAVSYDCHDPTNKVIKGSPVIGVFKKSNDQVVPTPAEKAWLVDRATEGFQAVPGVTCKSFK